MTGTEVLKLGESGITAHLQLLSLQCSDSPERHITKFSVVTLQQADAPLLIIVIIIIIVILKKPTDRVENVRNIPGFYAEFHLRVQKSCS